MQHTKMDLLLTCVVIFVTVFVKSGDAIQCYVCTGSRGTPGTEPTGTDCFDPFNAEGMTPTECAGQCFANSQVTQIGDVTVEMVERGCSTNPEENSCILPPTCLDVTLSEDAGGPGTARRCNYCCDEAMCNAGGLEEAAAAAGSNTCWNCQVNITEGMEVTPGSCSSNDFTGGTPPDVFPAPCQGMCLIAKLPAGVMDPDSPGQFMRTCDMPPPNGLGICTSGPPPEAGNIEFKCCEGDKCNVGGIDGGEDGDGDDDDDDDDDDDNDDDDDDDDDGEGDNGGEKDDGKTKSGDSKLAVHLLTLFSGLFASIYISFSLF